MSTTDRLVTLALTLVTLTLSPYVSNVRLTLTQAERTCPPLPRPSNVAVVLFSDDRKDPPVHRGTGSMECHNSLRRLVRNSSPAKTRQERTSFLPPLHAWSKRAQPHVYRDRLHTYGCRSKHDSRTVPRYSQQENFDYSAWLSPKLNSSVASAIMRRHTQRPGFQPPRSKPSPIHQASSSQAKRKARAFYFTSAAAGAPITAFAIFSQHAFYARQIIQAPCCQSRTLPKLKR